MAQAKQASEKINYVVAAKGFFNEVYEESKKVVWPNKETMIQSTMVVLVVIVVLAVFMAFSDYLLNLVFMYGFDNLKKFF